MKKLKTCLESLRAKTGFQPQVALILGSGLGDYADSIDIEQTVSYSEIEGFPTSTVTGHKGQFVFGHVQGVPVVIMQGRVHYYEGYPITDVVLPTRLMGLMGAKKLILTNAAGGINFDFQPGDFMLLTDHITTAVPSPLIGPNLDELGPRFPDTSQVYSLRMRDIIKAEAAKLNIPMREGVYVQLTGPSYETPAEIRMCRAWGATPWVWAPPARPWPRGPWVRRAGASSSLPTLPPGFPARPWNTRRSRKPATRWPPRSSR